MLSRVAFVLSLAAAACGPLQRALPVSAPSATPVVLGHELEVPPLPETSVMELLFPSEEERPGECGTLAGAQLARCLIAFRYASEPDAHAHAIALFERARVVPGIDLPRVMDDGDYRGRVRIEPALPAEHTPHLVTLNETFSLFDRFFEEITRVAQAPIRFRYRGVGIRFYRTVETRTPSAYVESIDSIAFNVQGELFDTAEGVRDTLFHELFHLNDAAHGKWSDRELTALYDALLTRCAGDESCFDLHAPHDTKVDGGIYYAFHPTSNVREYAAELAIRYLREQMATLAGAPIDRPFKCQTALNRIAWEKLIGEFFGNVDLTPPCTR